MRCRGFENDLSGPDGTENGGEIKKVPGSVGLFQRDQSLAGEAQRIWIGEAITGAASGPE